MLNNPTLCQYFVNQPLEVVCKQFSQPIIYHFMHDTLIASSDIDILEKVFAEVQRSYFIGGCKLLLKIQTGDSLRYLGFK